MRAILLTRNKQAIIKKINAKSNDWEFRKSIYILDPKRVQNYRQKGKEKVSGSQMIFFEDNPNPLNHEENPEDLSSGYLDDVVVINFIQQTTDTFGKWNPNLGILAWITSNMSRIPFFIMLMFIGWTLIKNYFVGGSF